MSRSRISERITSNYADLEQRVPVWPTTKFRIGSVSKPLTSAALVKLVEQGRLDLDAPIQKYVPSFPDKGAVITPRMLAGHLGGIPHYKDNEFLNSKHYDNVVAALAIFQDDRWSSSRVQNSTTQAMDSIC